MARANLTFDDLLFIARRTGVENWVDPATGQRGQVVSAPSSHRGALGKMGSILGCVRHHTGTAETAQPTSDYPTYAVVKEGRTGLENSLSAFGLGRFTGIYVFSEYLSWHAGVWSYGGTTDGNGHYLGIEAEGTGAKWSAFQREFYPRLCASILLFVGEGANQMPRHADGAMPRGRKDDAKNLWATFDAEVQGYLDNPATLTYGGPAAPEDDMFSDQDRKDLQDVKIALQWWLIPDDDPSTPQNESQPNSKGELGKRIRGTDASVPVLLATIAAQNRLIAAQNGVTVEDVDRVVRQAIADGVAVDVTVNNRASS